VGQNREARVGLDGSAFQMRVLKVHNHYLHEGGEDRVFAAEIDLLTSHGHDVRSYTRDNEDLRGVGNARLAATTLWSTRTFREVSGLLAAERHDVVHVHNTLPLVSPSVYHAARRAGVPVVQTLHNYRLLCPAATFLRDGRACEDCLGKRFAWPGVAHACYRRNRGATAVIATTYAAHGLVGTFRSTIDRYIALTEFGREKFIAGGLPGTRISVRPNYLADDPGVGDGRGGYALFVGRLSVEKGIATLLSAWRRLEGRIPLRIVGDGPLAAAVAEATRSLPGVTWLRSLPHPDALAQMRGATALVLPSEAYEAFPLTVVEAFASGTPVVATDIGAMREIVQHGETGLRFAFGDANELAERVERLFALPEERQRMGMAARARYLAAYTRDRAYDSLMEIYRFAGATSARKVP